MEGLAARMKGLTGGRTEVLGGADGKVKQEPGGQAELVANLQQQLQSLQKQKCLCRVVLDKSR